MYRFTTEDTEGRSFAKELVRKEKEEKKLQKVAQPVKQEASSSDSGESDSESGSDSGSGSGSDSGSGSGSGSDNSSQENQKIEQKAILNIKRKKYQGRGPVERFLKKKGYGGARVARENMENKFRDIYRGEFDAF